MRTRPPSRVDLPRDDALAPDERSVPVRELRGQADVAPRTGRRTASEATEQTMKTMKRSRSSRRRAAATARRPGGKRNRPEEEEPGGEQPHPRQATANKHPE